MPTNEEVTIIIKGVSQSLDEAIGQASDGLKKLDSSTASATRASAKLSEAEARTTRASRSLAEGVKVAADTVGMFGVESGRSASRVFFLRDAMGDLRSSFGSLKGAMLGGIGAMAAFAAADVLKASIKDAEDAQTAWAALGATFKGNAGAFEGVKKQIESGSAAWAKFGMATSEVASMMAQAKGRGLNVQQLLGEPAALADTAKALGTDIPTAMDAISRSGHGAMQVLSKLNLSQWHRNQFIQRYQNANPNTRTQALLGLVEHSNFAGSGAAAAGTYQGEMKTLGSTMKDLREQIGPVLLPMLTSMAKAVIGLVQSLNGMLRGFGGLAQFLKTMWLPLAAVMLAGFITLKFTISLIGDYFKAKLMPSTAGTADQLAKAASAATTFADALKAIPLDVSTVATFNAVTASTLKDAYIANIYAVPAATVTTATFNATAAESSLAAYQAEVAAVGAGAAVGVPSLAKVLAVSLAATVTTVALASGALTPLTNAIGSLTAHVTGFTAASFGKILKVVGHVTGWTQNKGVHAPAVNTIGRVTGWADNRGVHAPAVSTRAHIIGWVQNKGVHAPAANVTGNITKWTEANIPIVPLPGSVTLKGKVHVSGTVNINKAVVPKGTTLVVPGSLSVNNVVEPPGTKLLVNAIGRIVSIVLPTDKHGKATQISVPATAQVSFDRGAIGSALGKIPGFSSSSPVPLYVKPTVPKGTPPIPTNPPNGGGGGGGVGGFLGNLGQGLAIGIVESLIMSAILSKTLGNKGKGGGLDIGKLLKSIPGLNKTEAQQATQAWQQMLKATNFGGQGKGGTALQLAPQWDPAVADAIEAEFLQDVKHVNWKAVGTAIATDGSTALVAAGGTIVSKITHGIATSHLTLTGAGGWILGTLIGGIKLEYTTLYNVGADIIGSIFKGLSDWAHSHWPSWLPNPFPKAALPTHGKNYGPPALPPPKKHGIFPGAFGIDSGAGTGGYNHGARHVTNHNVFNINGAQHPQSVAHEIAAALTELERGMRGGRRLAG